MSVPCLSALLARLGWPSDLTGRLRWLLAAYAAGCASASGIAGLAVRRDWVGALLLVIGLTLTARWIYGYRRSTYGGLPAVVEIVLLVTVAAIGELYQFLLAPLVASALARATRDSARSSVPSVAGYGLACVVGSLRESLLGGGPPPGVVLVQILLVSAFLRFLMHALDQREVLQRQLAHQALHDALTGLPNRALIGERADTMSARAQDKLVAVLYIDLDGFKDVNDTLGHPVGDLLLAEAAARMARCVRPGDTLGRIGGDEFVVLLEGLSSVADVQVVARRLLEACCTPFDLNGVTVSLSASIGMAAGAGVSGVELMRDADVALYRAKAAGKACFVSYEPSMYADVQERLALDADLRQALARGEFFLAYQPIVALGSGRITGAEALLRWRHPDRGVLEAASFISALERSTMMTAVGEWVLSEACRQAAAWRAAGHDLTMSVNVSARQLEGEIARSVSEALQEAGLPGSALTLELTGTSVFRGGTQVLKQLEDLRRAGVRLAVDDFGTGYNSLLQLRSMPIDVLKIDRSFTADVASSPDAAALVQTLLDLGSRLGAQTVAEGIEDREQVAWLHQRCATGQGYFFSRAVPSGEFAVLLDHANDLEAWEHGTLGASA